MTEEKKYTYEAVIFSLNEWRWIGRLTLFKWMEHEFHHLPVMRACICVCACYKNISLTQTNGQWINYKFYDGKCQKHFDGRCGALLQPNSWFWSILIRNFENLKERKIERENKRARKWEEEQKPKAISQVPSKQCIALTLHPYN